VTKLVSGVSVKLDGLGRNALRNDRGLNCDGKRPFKLRMHCKWEYLLLIWHWERELVLNY